MTAEHSEHGWARRAGITCGSAIIAVAVAVLMVRHFDISFTVSAAKERATEWWPAALLLLGLVLLIAPLRGTLAGHWFRGRTAVHRWTSRVPLRATIILGALAFAGTLLVLLNAEGRDSVLDYLKVLAWPATIIGGLLLFRQPLQDLITRIEQGEVMGVSFTTRAANLADESASLEPPKLAQPTVPTPGSEPDTTAPPAGAEQENEPQILPDQHSVSATLDWVRSHSDPTVTILVAWEELNRMAYAIVEPYPVLTARLRPRAGVVEIVRVLARYGLVSSESPHVAQDLRNLRNEVAHVHKKADWDAASSYLTAVENLMTMLSWAKEILLAKSEIFVRSDSPSA